MSYLAGVAVQSILMICHTTGSPYNFNIQFPICTQLLTHKEGVALNTFMP